MALAAGLLAAAGCDSPGPSVRPPPAAPTAAPPPAPIADPLASGASGLFRSARFDLLLPLPDGRAWAIDDHKESWLRAEHRATASSLVLRAWREDLPVSRARCEEQARLSRTLPERRGTVAIETRHVDVPPGHDTALEVLVRAAPGKPVEGIAMAFGASGRRCFAFAFVTSAAREEIVAERLAAITDGTFSRMRFESALSPPREPLPQ
jgi:hypothetical protein